jgi:hypothetical protein
MYNRFGFSHGALHRVRRVVFTTLFLITLSTSSCGIPPAIDRATTVIDNAIRDITLNLDNWQTILQRVANDLPNEISETIRFDAQSLVTRSIAVAGIEFRCDVEFLGNRAIESLRHLKAKLLNQNPSLLPPKFCNVDPPAIDLKVSPSKWSTVMLSGYDFDTQDHAQKLLQVSFLTKQGNTLPFPESRIGRTTHYQITLNLGEIASALHTLPVTKIFISWDGKSQGYPQIVVIPWEARRQTVTQNMGDTGPFFPPRAGGDADFDTDDDDPTDVVLRGLMRVTEQSIDTRIAMYARERKPDHTAVDGWSEWARNYTPPQGWRIVSVNPTLPSYHQAVVTEHDRMVYNRPAGEVVSYFEAWVDHDDDEAGTWTRVIAHWRSVNITIEETKPDWMN